MDQHLETLRDEVERALGGLDDRQTQLRTGSDPSRWSIQQTIGHLLKTYAVTEDALDARIEKGTGTKARPSIAQRAGQVVILRGGLFPRGRKAPERVCPSPEEAAVPSGVLIHWMGVALKNLDLRVSAAERIFGRERQAVSHMILGPLSLEQWTRFHLVHGRHHLKCVARIRKEFGI